jgi:tripartite-type tricarboxylate transporter receptor subunit TctC
MSRGLGQQVVVDNRPGAGGQIGAEAVAHATADGYTILFGTNGALGIGPAIYKNLRYDPLHDLAPVGILHKLPLLLIINPSVPAKNVTELIAYARSNPGKLTFASAGVGSVSHLAGELFKQEARIDILHVPYKGGGAAVSDLISGRVSMMLETIPNALPLARDGRMRAIGVTTKERSALAPDIPSLAETGLPGFDHRSAQCRDPQDRQRSEIRGADPQHGHGRHEFEPAGIRQLCARRYRAMDQGD